MEERDEEKVTTGAETARVEAEYERLDATETKLEFDKLYSRLDRHSEQVGFITVNQIIPDLERMQALLSQRGRNRKQVLKAAGLPSWQEYASGYAAKLNRSFRTIQDHITGFRRTGKSGPSQSKGSDKGATPLRLDRRQQASLVKAQLAANDLVAALKAGHDWREAVSAYESVAVSPSKLESFVNTVTPEPDWRAVIADLMKDLEEVGDRLPLKVLSRVRTIEKMLAGESAPPLTREARENSECRFQVAMQQGGEYAVVDTASGKIWQTFPTEDEADCAAEALNRPVVVFTPEQERGPHGTGRHANEQAAVS